MKKFSIIIVMALALFSQLAAAATLQIAATAYPSSIVPGTDGYMQLDITNTGATAVSSVKIRTLNLDSPITLKTPVYLEDMGSLDSGKIMSSLIRFTVPTGTSSGFYNAQFVIEACDSSTCKQFINYALIIVQPPSTLEVTKVTPTFAQKGQTIDMNLTLTNDGSTVLNNIVLSWSDSTNKILPIGSSNRKFISLIPAKSSIVIPLNIVVSPAAESGTYPLSVSMVYNDNTGTRQTVNSTIGFKVIGDFDFIMTMDSQDIAVINKSAGANIKIANGGTDEVQFLVVRMESDAKITPEKIYVGNIQSNDYDTEKITFVSMNSGSVPVKVFLEYRDIYGNAYANEGIVYLNVLTKEEYQQHNQTGNSTGILLALAFVVFVIAFILHRRRKKK